MGVANNFDTTSNGGTCVCTYNATGTLCEYCNAGYAGPNCTSTFCQNGSAPAQQTLTSSKTACLCNEGWALDSLGSCTVCAPNYTGTNCNQCVAGKSGAGCQFTPQCQNGTISNTADTTSNSGSCVCPSNYTGQFCEYCNTGYAGPNCTSTFCKNGSAPTQPTLPSSKTSCTCNQGWVLDSLGSCTLCAEGGYAGPNCTLGFCGASDAYVNDKNPNAAIPCTCIGRRIVGSDKSCSACSPNFEGANCDKCISGYSGANCSKRPNCRNNDPIYVNTYDTTSPTGSCTHCNINGNFGYNIDVKKGCEACIDGYSGNSCMYTPTCYNGTIPNIYNTFGEGGCSYSCYGNRDYSTGCSTCLAGYSGSGCQYSPYCYNGTPNVNDISSSTGSCTCINGFNPDTNCKTCKTRYIGNTCNQCITGYSGANCDSQPVCQNGGVINSSDSTTVGGSCVCPTGYAGQFCQLCDSANGYGGPNCTANYCNGNGTPSSDPNGLCTCMNKFNPTSRCSTCNTGYAGSTCNQCLSGYSGPNCGSQPVCQNGSTANISDLTTVGGSCVCPTGFTGQFCQLCDSANGYGGPNCTANYCNGNGTPSSDPNGLCTCMNKFNPTSRCSTCNTGYAGSTCNQCLSGYSGPNCGSQPVCQNGSTANISDLTTVGGSCVCPVGFTGQFCQFCDSVNGYGGPSCAANYCNGKGTPSSDLNGLCACINGFNPTSRCATCKTGYNGSECNQCASGYSGPNCGSQPACQNGSTANTSDITTVGGSCACPTGFTGQFCQLCDSANGYGGPNCTANYCNGNGTASSEPNGLCACINGFNTTSRCATCKTGYTGSECNQCASGYSGSNCVQPACQNGSTVNISDFSTVGGSCICPVGFKGQFCQLCAPGYAGPNCKADFCLPTITYLESSWVLNANGEWINVNTPNTYNVYNPTTETSPTSLNACNCKNQFTLGSDGSCFPPNGKCLSGEPINYRTEGLIPEWLPYNNCVKCANNNFTSLSCSSCKPGFTGQYCEQPI